MITTNAAAWLEPGTEAFGANVDADELRAMLHRFPESERGTPRPRAGRH
ncbi:hypothetical protein ACFYR1_37250 [Streptomyces canus]